jgi:glucose/arabinose dehydrogenase
LLAQGPLTIAHRKIVEIMTRICILVTLLTCVACSPQDQSAPRANPAAADTPAPAAAPPTATTEAKLPPVSQTPAPTLKPRYPDKAALLADLQTTHPSSAVELDGKDVWSGFGPALQYRTNGDGSISR